MVPGSYRPLRTVHLVWHSACPDGVPLGRALFTALFEDPDDLTTHGMRIPVRLWTGDPEPPPVPDLSKAERSFVVVLVDRHFLITPGWRDHLADLTEACADGGHVLVPVALTKAAFGMPDPVAQLNWIRAVTVKKDVRATFILNRLVHEMYRDLTDTPLRVFLSHAKLDGLSQAREIRDFLNDGTGVDNWFDAQDLPPGSRWEKIIENTAANGNLMVVVRSDAYATREWCRIEVLEAKRAGSPVVVVDALHAEERRSFPYLGNGPVVRWEARSSTRLERLLTVLVLEALRYEYFPRRVDQLCELHACGSPQNTTARPPELLTLLEKKGGTLVYPDPPLGVEEMDLLGLMAPGVRPITPTQLLAEA
ncbi:toll/interleukin-1 receptor domain-containing protein [Actinoplanes sp. NPDC049681]|uniref:toll/interleukin-1 receptor domain-containing protein n=1 Tax=Actinoplanes sp. NPDC049681 TaxID=3363905 RepID=UPI0037BB1907